jgi:hypothetical protein
MSPDYCQRFVQALADELRRWMAKARREEAAINHDPTAIAAIKRLDEIGRDAAASVRKGNRP